MLEAVAGADVKLTADQREECAADLRLILAEPWKNPQLAEAIGSSKLTVSATRAGADGNSAEIDYVVKLTTPREVELGNTVFLKKAKDGWRIWDLKQANGPRMTEALKGGFAQYKKAEPNKTLAEFLFEVLMQVGGATRAPATRPAGR
jgi:hypothetical protein